MPETLIACGVRPTLEPPTVKRHTALRAESRDTDLILGSRAGTVADVSAVPDHTPDVSPATLGEYRARIDAVDDILAGLLEYRAELTVAVQQLKAGASREQPRRDHQREAEIVARMAGRAPGLGPVRLQRIMNAVIEAGLDLSAERH